jgi:hypothetical protein
VRLAARGARESAGGVVAVTDPDEVLQLKRQARRIHVESIAIAVVTLGVAMIARSFAG